MTYALSLLAISGTTDILDGYLARRYKSATVFGSIADPAADKALMTVMVGALAFRGLIPLPLVILIIGRDVGLVLSAFIIRWRTLPEKFFSVK
jgi:cardiolipin synthase